MGNQVDIFRLSYKILTSCKNNHSKIDVSSIEDYLVLKHCCQFSGRNNYQCIDSIGILGDLGQNWENEQETLALTSHRIGQQIASLENNWQSCLLDLSGGVNVNQSEFLFEKISDL